MSTELLTSTHCKDGKFLPVTCHVALRESRGIDLLSPKLGTGWRWVVTATPWTVCPQKRFDIHLVLARLAVRGMRI